MNGDSPIFNGWRIVGDSPISFSGTIDAAADAAPKLGDAEKTGEKKKGRPKMSDGGRIKYLGGGGARKKANLKVV